VLEQVQAQAESGFLAYVAVAVAIWYGSVGVRSLMSALNVAYNVEEENPAWKSYPLSIVLTIGLMLTIAAATALMLVGPQVVTNLLSSQMGLGQQWVALWSWVRWPLAVILLLFGVAVVYRFGPNSGGSFHFVTPGAVLAVTVWMAASLGFRYYMLNFEEVRCVLFDLLALVARLVAREEPVLEVF
jgi:membrane protein